MSYALFAFIFLQKIFLIPANESQQLSAMTCAGIAFNNRKKSFVRGLDYGNPDEKKLSDQVRKNSPWLKSQGLV